MLKIIIIVLIVLLVLGITAGAVFFFVLDRNDSGSEEAVEEPGVIFSTGDFYVTNIRDSDLLLRSTVYLRISSEDVSMFEENSQRLRDRIIRVLRQFGEEDIVLPDFQDTVRDKIISDLQASLGVERIIDVYFVEFVVQ